MDFRLQLTVDVGKRVFRQVFQSMLKMKYSSYNSEISIADKHTLLYNALSGKFVVVRDKILHADTIGLQELKGLYPSLFEQLCSIQFIIEDSVDELKILKERIAKADNNSDEFILHINPTLDCNFRCWYCYENHIPRSLMSQETLENTKNFISRTLANEQIRHFELGFFGGEPLLHFHKVAAPIIEHTRSACRERNVALHVHFTTNGSLLTDAIAELLSKVPCGFQITLDGGKEKHDKTRFHKSGKGSFDQIILNILRLTGLGKEVNRPSKLHKRQC